MVIVFFRQNTTADNLLFLGLFELEPGTIVFAWPFREDGVYDKKDDIVEGWCLDG